MICLGLDGAAKDAVIVRYCGQHAIRKVFILSPEKFRFACSFPSHEHIAYAEIIMYRTFYRLLQEIDRDVLVVVNECLRTQNRHDLTYNCIRHFLGKTRHVVVFQYLPIIDSLADTMVLVDFVTQSRWKRDPFRREMLNAFDTTVVDVAPTFSEYCVHADTKTREKYEREKQRLFDTLGQKDPHTIPRTLYLLSGALKVAEAKSFPGAQFVGRNNRFGLPNLRTFKESSFPPHNHVFELPHNVIEFADFLALSRQRHVEVMTSTLKVDGWYFDRYQAWAQRVRDAYAALRVS